MLEKLFDSRKRYVVYGALAAAVAAAAFICLTCGRMPLSVSEVWGDIAAHLTGGDVDHNIDLVVFSLRIPRILLALFVGAGLACAGASYQSVFSNPLATPDTLGVASGAAVGAVVGLLLDFPMAIVHLSAFLAGLGATALTVMFARVQATMTITRLILSGVIMTLLMNATISIVKLVADPADQLPEITYWLMGGLTGATDTALTYGGICITVGIAGLMLLRWRLNILALSEEEARASGMRIAPMRLAVIVLSTLITASVVSICGQVGWVGLVIPHCARLICGSNNRFVIPTSVLLGALFMVVVDTAARSALAMEIPLSILTAFIGAPVFVVLLRNTGRAVK